MNIQFLAKKDFIEHTAHDCLCQRSEDDKERTKEILEPLECHFGLGMFIRNNYIYGDRSIRFEMDSPYDLSSEIIDRILAILSE